MVLLGIFFTAIVVPFIFIIIKLIGSDLSQVVLKKQETKKDQLAEAVFWLGLFIFLALGLIINFIRSRILPVATFLIGDGIKRHETIVSWRRAIGVGFFLSLLASVFATWLLS
jgi:thiol:disulfide interchange protein